MNKIYQRIDWENYPSSATPLNEDNLNKMDYAIDKLDDRIVTHETTKLNTATGNTLVKNVTFNETTGVFTIEKLSGSKITINTALEKISTNFQFNPTTQKLVLTLIDGTVQEIDLSALITQYEFLESDTITFEIDANGKVKANILNGSITGEKLEPNYLANVTLQAKNAKTSADNAKTSEELAYQYAEEARESASQTAKSDAKNITYDNTESGLSATNVKDALDEVAQGSVSAITTDTTITDSTNAPLIYGKFKGYTKQQMYSGKNKSSVGSLTGTPSENIPIDYLTNGTTYTLSCVLTSTDTDSSLCGVYRRTTSSETFLVNEVRNTRVSITFTKATEDSFIRIYAGAGYSASIGDTITISDIQIEEGTTATPYEPYVGGIASPNPDYPQEINGLAKDGAIEVKTTGNNLCDVGSISNTISVKIPIDHLINGETYMLSCKITSTDTDNNKCAIYQKNSFISHYVRDSRVSVKFIKNADNITIYASVDYENSRNDTVTVTDIQIEKGEVATEYEPHKETAAAIPTDAPLYEGDYLEVYADGSGKVVKKMGSVVFDGSGDEAWLIHRNNNSENTICFRANSNVGAKKGAVICNKLVNTVVANVDIEGINNSLGSLNYEFIISINKARLSTLDSAGLNTWLQSNPITVLYELAEPTETPLTAEQVEQFKKLYSFEHVTNVLCDGEVEIQYYKNTDSGETVAMVSKKANNSVSKSSIANNLTTTTEGMVLDATQGKALDDKISTLNYSLENRLSKSLVSTETINIDSLSLSSGGYSTITSEEIHKSGYTLVSAKFFLRGSYAENIIASFTIGGSNTKIYNFAFYNPSDYNISAYGYVDLIYVANSL